MGGASEDQVVEMGVVESGIALETNSSISFNVWVLLLFFFFLLGIELLANRLATN